MEREIWQGEYESIFRPGWPAPSKFLSAYVAGVNVPLATAGSCARQTTTTVQPTSAATEPSVWTQSMATHASAPRASGMVEERLRRQVAWTRWQEEAGMQASLQPTRATPCRS